MLLHHQHSITFPARSYVTNELHYHTVINMYAELLMHSNTALYVPMGKFWGSANSKTVVCK